MQYIYGLSGSVDDFSFLNIDELSSRVGANTGNLAFCYAISKQLNNPPVKPWSTSESGLFKKENIAVLPLANQLGQHVDMGWKLKYLRKNESKLVGIGLGAQASADGQVVVPPGTREWVQEIQDRSPTSMPNISLRGEFTQSILKDMGMAEKTVVLGCPTLFISPDFKLGETIFKKWKSNGGERIAITAGHPAWTHLCNIEKSLIRIMGDGAYIAQSPKSMIDLGRGREFNKKSIDFDKIKNYLMPNVDEKEFIDWQLRHAVSFFSAPVWMDYLKRFDFVVGTRIHGVMLALQSGIPAMCIVHDSRTRELCKTMRIPCVEAKTISSGFDKSELLKMFEFDPISFDLNRLNLLKKYVQFLENNKINYAKYLNIV